MFITRSKTRLHRVRPGKLVQRGGELGGDDGRDFGGDRNDLGSAAELGPEAGFFKLAGDLVFDLLELAVDLLVDLAGDEGAEAAVAAGQQPEEGVDEIEPDGVAHEAHTRVLVPFVLGVVGHAQEDDGEGAEDGDPEHEEGEVPGEEPRGPHEGLRDGEGHGRHGAQRRNEQRVHPLHGLRPVVAVVRAHARAVQTDDDEGEDQLQTTADEAEPGLVDVYGLGYGALAELGGE